MRRGSLQRYVLQRWTIIGGILFVAMAAAGVWSLASARSAAGRRSLAYQPRKNNIDTSGLSVVMAGFGPRLPQATASLQEISTAWRRAGYRNIELIDRKLAAENRDAAAVLPDLLDKAMLLNYEGEPAKAYAVLDEMRSQVQDHKSLARDWLFTIVYLQGVMALRRGENENCILCRGESSCILPIASAAVHTNPDGSRLAIERFTEYLRQFPADLEVRWLLNLAHMTLGEHPEKVDPRFLISLDHFRKCEFDIGRFRDVGHIVGVNRFNQAGGAIMEDFDNDGLLDIVVTTADPTESMAIYRNTGDGTFFEWTAAAGVTGQLGGLNCVQSDFDNDGFMDVYITRGAWMNHPVRPTLLKNNGDGTFSDVTEQARLLVPVNSNSAIWADYDNDGQLDLFVCCEAQPSRLFRNLGNGSFLDVTAASGLLANDRPWCKGAAWIDFDNDGFPDLFLNYLFDTSRLFRNNRDGTFRDVTYSSEIEGPQMGFSCWAWDYDNDGWLDLFATCFDRTLEDVVKGLIGQPHSRNPSRLYHNVQGERFEIVTQEAGLDLVFATMGSNFADFDNDGFLDIFLGTGDPRTETLVPDRMFKNVAGRRFAEVTACSRTGHLQKGHGVACGDWDRDGNVDIFVEMGGAVNGDKYHNVLFQNPGHENSWLTVKLTGKMTNRPAIGARIKVVVEGHESLTVHRHVSSGSSFGANPIEQTIGLGGADRVALLEIHWPGSKTTQTFHNLAVNQSIQVTEFADDYHTLRQEPISLPNSPAKAKRSTARGRE